LSAGRPAASFSLSSGNLPPIVARFLEGIGDLLDRPELDIEMREKILDSFIDSIISSFHPQGTGTTRMNEIVKFLTQLGFSARWELAAADRQSSSITIRPHSTSTTRSFAMMAQRS